MALVKAHCSVDFDEDDALLETYVKAVIAGLEGYGGKLGIYLIHRTVTQEFSGFDGQPITLMGPWVEAPDYPDFTYLSTAPPQTHPCLLYTSPSPRDRQKSRMPSSA